MNSPISTKTFQQKQGLMARGLVHSAVIALATALLITPAQAAFHLWSIQEVYTDSGGSVQFIELFDASGFQNFVGGQSLSAVSLGGATTHTYTLPGVTLGGNTFNQTLLFGTAGLQAAGGPAPDFIIPNNFLFSAGGTINFFGQNSGPYSALPTDGILSRTWGGGNAVNSPKNYLGQPGFVPEPTLLTLFGIGGVSLCLLRRRST